MIKYYTPNLDEFHPGLDFEVNIDGKWRRENIQLFEDADMGNFRVKYLDADDIMNLGFELYAESRELMVFRMMSNSIANPTLIEIKLEYMGIDPLITVIEYSPHGEMAIIVEDIVIKNKSEFQWLLNRLGIC